MTQPIVVTNARVVRPNEVVHGTLVWSGDTIAAVETGGTSLPQAIDCAGDFLVPGLVELHTDHLEKHFSPRLGVEWDAVSAAISHDLQLAGSGITTVFDSIVLGAAPGWEMRDKWLRPMLDGLTRARRQGVLRAEHRLHLRCEVTHPEIAELVHDFLDEPTLGLMSLMDHAPGDRQSPDIDAYKARYRKSFGMDEAAVDAHVDALLEGSRLYGASNRRKLAAIAAGNGLPLASHDDASEAHVEEAVELGCALTEFPTTEAAALAARRGGLAILMGAPNLIRGGSHSGNVAAGALAQAGLIDILSSDYIPSSLLMAAFRLALDEAFGIALPTALATVTAAPAAAAGLADRGRLEPGLRADIVRVRVVDGRPVVRTVWVAGERVA